MLFLQEWVLKYGFSVEFALYFLILNCASSWTYGSHDAFKVILIIAALLVSCSIVMCRNWLKSRDLGIYYADWIKKSQSASSIAAFYVGTISIAFRIVSTGGLNLWIIVYGIILTVLAVYRIIYGKTAAANKNIMYVSCAQLLIPAIMWMQLAI